MRKIFDGLVAVLQLFSGVLCLVMLGVVLLGIFYRYVVGEALSWYDEFAGFILVWLTMYGSVLALARRKHISFDTLVEKMPRPVRRAVDIFGVLCVLSFSLVLLIAGWQLLRGMAEETVVSVPEIKIGWIYSVMPISGALMVFISLLQLFRAGARGPGAELEKAKPMEEAQ